MANPVIRVENLSKQYRLGLVGSGSLRDDLIGMWYRMRGKEDPTLKIGEENKLANSTGDYVWALQNINFEVQKGEVLGIIGKNGAGKSTLLKILSQITAPTKGSIKMRGRVASLLEVGTGMHPELTGRDNIYLNGAILGMKRHEIKAKLDEIVDFAGIAKYIDTPVKRYSSGMRVRLGFAVAAYLEPEILIVDEVLAVGDAEFQKKAIGKMQEVSKGGGRTVLFVSHNMQSMRALCSKAILLQSGRLVYQDTVSNVVEKYLTLDAKKASQKQVSFTPDVKKAFQVLRAKTQDIEGNVRDNFECEENIFLVLECISRKAIAQLYAYLAIYDQNGTIVWETDTMDTGVNPLDSLSTGEHTFQIKIPRRSLASGQYLFYLNVGSPRASSFNIDSLGYFMSFNLVDTFTRRGNQRNGYFSTLLEWK